MYYQFSRARKFIKRQAWSYSPCPVLYALHIKELIFISIAVELGTISYMPDVAQRLESIREETKVQGNLKEYSIHLIPSFSNTCAIISIHHLVKRFIIFGAEPVSRMLLDISTFLKESPFVILADRSQSLSAINITTDMSNVRADRKCFSVLYLFSKRIKRTPARIKLPLSLFERRMRLFLTLLLSEQGITDMLETFDFDLIDQLSPFLGANADK